MFALMAESSIAQTILPCRFDVPEPPNGEDIDFSSIEFEFTPVGGAPQLIPAVSGENVCDADGGFYIEGEVDQIALCPASCEAVQQAPNAAIEVRWGCTLNIE